MAATSFSSRVSGFSATGVNAGFLWNIGEAGSIYITNDHGECSPFDNPKFVKAFEQAEVIAFRCLRSDKKQPLWLQKADTLFRMCAKKSAKCISDEQLAVSHAKLEQLMQSLPPSPFLKGIEQLHYDDPRMQFAINLFVYVLSTLAPAKGRQELHEEMIRSKAEAAGKKIVSLIDDEKFIRYCIVHATLLFRTPGFYTFVNQYLLSEKSTSKIRDQLQAGGKAWDLGFTSFETPFPISSKDIKRLDQAFEEEHGKVNYKQMLALSEHYLKLMQINRDLFVLKLGKKITSLSKTTPQFMVVDSDSDCKRLFETFSRKDIPVQGPIRESMKPIGFLWEIRKTDRVVGYFLGSIHIVPNWILENFNSRILEAFASCDVLGVEVDVTREEFSHSSNNFMDACFPGWRDDEKVQKNVRRIVKEGIQVHHIELDKTDPEFLSKGMRLVTKAVAAKHGTESGIDFFFISRAKQRQIEVVDLESVEIHEGFLTLLQEERKGSSAKWDYNTFEKGFERLICQKYPEILEMGMIHLLEERNETAEHKHAMNRRNMVMAMTTDRLIREGKMPFAIAGAGHFTGKLGMNQLMKQMGYQVRQVICEEPRGNPAATSSSSASSMA